MTGDLRISVVMPVYNGGATLRLSLAPLSAMREAGEIEEIVVVDDGSTDDTVAVAREFNARILPSGGRLGPGGARNVAAPTASGDILWFVDADVVVHPDSARVLVDAFRRTEAAAVFGTYDDYPPAANFFSQYKNLVHRYQHVRAAGDADTFWAGCGAIRKQVFIDIGGFDALRYPYSSIEDIELGWRMRQRGLRICAVPELLATHLKVWRIGNLLHTEIFRRAVPWSRLILARGWWSNTINMRAGERVRASLALLGLAATVLSVTHPVWHRSQVAVLMAVALVIAVANAQLFRFFQRRRGFLFAVRATLYHQIYYIYSSLTFAWCWIDRHWRRAMDRLAGRRGVS